MYEPYEGKEGIWIYAPSYDSLPNERVMKIYRTKEEWFPIWEEMCKRFVEESTARWQKGFGASLRQARNEYPNLSDEELKREVLHFDYWLSKYEEQPARARRSVVRRTEEGDERGFYDIGSYGSFTFVPLEDMPWVRLRAENDDDDDDDDDDDYEYDCMNCGEGIEDMYSALKMGYEWLCYPCQHEYTDEELDEALESYKSENMSLRESAKLGFGVGAGLLGFRIVALTGAVALGALLNRR